MAADGLEKLIKVDLQMNAGQYVSSLERVTN